MKLNLVRFKNKKIVMPLILVLIMGMFFISAEFLFRIKDVDRCKISNDQLQYEVKNLNDYFCLSYDPDIAVRLKSFINIKLAGETFKTNDLGYRTPKFNVHRRKGTFRILGIGDSVMAGWGVPEKSDFLSLLRSKLNSKSREVEVINLSVPGYNAIQESLLLTNYLPVLRPDLVIINYVGNDWEEQIHKRIPRFSSKSYLLNFIVLNIQKIIGLIPKEERINLRPVQFRKRTPEHLGEAYQEMARALTNQQIPSIVVLDSRYESPMAPHFGVINILNQLGFKNIVDLMTLMRGKHIGSPETNQNITDRHNKELIIKGDGHPNAKWHKEVSEILAPIIGPYLR